MIVLHNRVFYGIAVLLGLAILVGVVRHALHRSDTDVVVLREGRFVVPGNCKRIALIGATPNPTLFLQNNRSAATHLGCIRIDDFIDVSYLKDSFEQLLKLCVDLRVDHLVFAYLPVYYSKIQEEYGDKTPKMIEAFLTSLVPQMRNAIIDVVRKCGINVSVTIMPPVTDEINRIPAKVHSPRHYAQYLTKEFPRLDFSNSQLETVVIINTNQIKNATETEDIVSYLQYEYLFERALTYEQAFIDKPSVHKYKYAA